MIEKEMLTQKQVISRLIKWIKECEKLYGRELPGYALYVVESCTDGIRIKYIEFIFDSELFEIIEGYFSSGYNPNNLGSKYETIFNGTNWLSESQYPGVHHIYKQE